MIAAALLPLLLSQAPQCVNVGGARTCGFNCVDNGARAECAQTPFGVCAKNGGAVKCFDPPTWLQAVWKTPPKPTCLTDGTTIACGYDCKRFGGNSQCAQTPNGVCSVTGGYLTCFDPPPEVYGAYGGEVPAPTCLVREGMAACGYSCRTANGKTMCAKTPFGVCGDDGRDPVCFDPPKAVICAKGKDTPKPKCVPTGGSFMTCGYTCATASSTTVCSQTPDGTCDTNGPGKPQCFDPPARGGSAACLEAAAASPSK
ncbi:MAG: hypothetical protein JNM17_29890 [Archangium sp.]|nr:hypothetical protein [Archangium sp.]